MRARQQTFLHAGPAEGAEAMTEVLLGEELTVLEEASGWQHVRLAADGYEGWVRTVAAETPAGDGAAQWATVTALRGHIYAAPAVQAPVLGRLSLGSRVCRSGEVTELFAAGTAAVITPITRVCGESDPAGIAVGDGTAGPTTVALREHLVGIQLGEIEDTRGWVRYVD